MGLVLGQFAASIGLAQYLRGSLILQWAFPFTIMACLCSASVLTIALSQRQKQGRGVSGGLDCEKTG